jgi:SH3-like domain-containing protein
VAASRATLAALTLAGALAAPGAALAEYRSIATNGTILYDAPNTRATKLFVASANYPVEVILTDGAWARIRDVAGDLAWVERKSLSDKRTVLVNVPSVEARQKPDDRSPAAFQAAQGVVLDFLDAESPGWLRVRHRDGLIGFVRVREVWGN